MKSTPDAMSLFSISLAVPREIGCSHLGGCSISDVNKDSDGRTESVFICFYFVYNLGEKRKQQTDCFHTERYELRMQLIISDCVRLIQNAFLTGKCNIFTKYF